MSKNKGFMSEKNTASLKDNLYFAYVDIALGLGILDNLSGNPVFTNGLQSSEQYFNVPVILKCFESYCADFHSFSEIASKGKSNLNSENKAAIEGFLNSEIPNFLYHLNNKIKHQKHDKKFIYLTITDDGHQNKYNKYDCPVLGFGGGTLRMKSDYSLAGLNADENALASDKDIFRVNLVHSKGQKECAITELIGFMYDGLRSATDLLKDLDVDPRLDDFGHISATPKKPSL